MNLYTRLINKDHPLPPDYVPENLSYLPVIAQHTSDILVRCERAATACENLSKNISRIIVPRGSQSSYQVGVTLN